MEEQNIKLTKLTKCAGCGAKVGAGVLAQLLEGIRVHHDPNLLVGFDKSDDASVYKISDELALVQTVDFTVYYEGVFSCYEEGDKGGRHQRPQRRVCHGRRAEAVSEHHGRAGGYAEGGRA